MEHGCAVPFRRAKPRWLGLFLILVHTKHHARLWSMQLPRTLFWKRPSKGCRLMAMPLTGKASSQVTISPWSAHAPRWQKIFSCQLSTAQHFANLCAISHLGTCSFDPA
ncbi:hypothetical protein DM02DRAFT_164912 [Periconia macrospinosa]|uniref:Uncharacterized protein n=1 Tax=Periconia macrospinosa TaxID=97972 RepID=A0A2V1DAX2_9PLEO|nr:hypothetical protein DM02DRAFT_164912 [Periconia macrospinosa]